MSRFDEPQLVSDGMALMLMLALTAALATIDPRTLWRSAIIPAVRSNDLAIEVSLSDPLPEPTPPSPLPIPHKVVTQRVQPRPVPTVAMPVEQQPVPVDAAVITTSATPPETPSEATTSSADLEAQYAAGLRINIDRRTRAPDSAEYRLHRPSGEARVRFVVTRNGEPKGVTLMRSSGSRILDDAAVAIVASGIYAPMPAQLFAGEVEHVFAVSIEFRPH